MTARFVVRVAASDDGLHLFWIVDTANDDAHLCSSVFRDSLVQIVDGMNARAEARAVARNESGCWT